MGGEAILGMLAVGSAGALSLPPLRGEAVVHRRVVMLGDVSDLSVLPEHMRHRAETIAIATIAYGTAREIIPAAAIYARLRSRIPMFAAASAVPGPTNVTVRYEAAAQDMQKAHGVCLMAATRLDANQLARSSMFSPVPCPDVLPARAFHYDGARRSVRFIRSLAMREVVAMFPGYGKIGAYAGDRLSLVSVVGPVTVTRIVEAVQSARPNQPVLVRSGDGEFLSAQFEGGNR